VRRCCWTRSCSPRPSRALPASLWCALALRGDQRTGLGTNTLSTYVFYTRSCVYNLLACCGMCQAASRRHDKVPVGPALRHAHSAMLVQRHEPRAPARQEVKTTNALSVLQYSCSARTMALHTGELNARRCAPRRAHLGGGAPPMQFRAALAAGPPAFVPTAPPQPAL